MRVAILGTGKMGSAMARRLAAQGHDLILWNRTPSRAESVGAGQVASTPAGAVMDAEVVISILTDAEAVRTVYLGDHGAAKAARGQVFVEMSTAGPDVTKEIAPVIRRTGAEYIEAPVMGSTPAVESGKLVILAAGDEQAIEKATPVLEGLGEVQRTGDYGTAAALKLIANTMLAGVTALAAELQAAGTAAGLDPDFVFATLSRFVPALALRKAGLVEHRYEPVTFSLRDIVKDLNLAMDVYRRAGASTPLTDAAKELYERLVTTKGSLEMSAVASLYEKTKVA